MVGSMCIVTKIIKHYTQQNVSLSETEIDCDTEQTQFFFFLTLPAQSIFHYCITNHAPQSQIHKLYCFKGVQDACHAQGYLLLYNMTGPHKNL